MAAPASFLGQNYNWYPDQTLPATDSVTSSVWGTTSRRLNTTCELDENDSPISRDYGRLLFGYSLNVVNDCLIQNVSNASAKINLLVSAGNERNVVKQAFSDLVTDSYVVANATLPCPSIAGTQVSTPPTLAGITFGVNRGTRWFAASGNYAGSSISVVTSFCTPGVRKNRSSGACEPLTFRKLSVDATLVRLINCKPINIGSISFKTVNLVPLVTDPDLDTLLTDSFTSSVTGQIDRFA